jgi:hypothetical protein
MRKDPAWKAWVKLVELYSYVVLHEMDKPTIKKIDDLQFEYTHLYDQVPEYVGLKRPKHHFLSHLAPDIWRFGPPRGYWCYGFEAFNRVMKAGARVANKRSTAMSVLEYVSLRHARAMVRRSQSLAVELAACASHRARAI